jgi:hypothetical protein
MTECLRKPYAESAARERGEQTGKGSFRCQWCGDWHLGVDPGPVAPCWRCATLITIPERGTPLDAARGWLHDARRCRPSGEAA